MSITIALAGNPNSGKTTIFNALTGSNQFVGNWPGVTVEKKEGRLKTDKDISVMDLPGIYSLSPYTLEEVVARNYLLEERPDVILNIVDGTNIERNLYLTTQLTELGIPVVIAVNMMDIVNKNGDKIDLEKLREATGCETAAVSALKGEGLDEAVKCAVKAAKGDGFNYVHKFSNEVEDKLRKITDRLPVSMPDSHKRFYAVKLFERDDKLAEGMPDVSDIIDEAEKEFDDDSESIITNERYNYITSIINECLKKQKKARMSVSDKIDCVVTNRWLALPIFAVVMFIVYYFSVTTVGTYATDWANDGLFGEGWHLFGIGTAAYEEAAADWEVEKAKTDAFISVAEESGIDVQKLNKTLEEEEPDRNVINTFIEEAKDVSTVFDIENEEGEESFEIRAADFISALGAEEPDPADFGVWIPGIPAIAESGLESLGTADWLNSLIIDGIIGGVGAVLGFVPQMLVLFIFLAFLESCGYMARIAFIMDRIFRRFGLSGKSFIPMLIGSGCGVPGIMASRTIESDRDRKMTIMTTTFVPCGAKLPIIALIAGALFDGAWWVAPSAYFVGIAAIIVSGIILKKTAAFAGDPAPFVMELPAYHMPTVGNVLRSMWERGWSFIKKAGTIILLSTIVLWFLRGFGFEDGFGMVEDLNNSVLSKICGIFAPLFVPLGWGDWKMTAAAVTGLIAKENVVGTLGILFGFAEVAEDGMEIWGNLASSYTAAAAYSFLVFNLLCAPCFAAIGAIKREMNNAKWTWFAIGYQTIFAYAVSLCIYQIGMLVSEGVFTFGTVIAFALIVVFIYLLVRPYKQSNVLKTGKSVTSV